MVARLIRPPSSHHFSVRLTLRPGPDAAAKQCRIANKCKKCPPTAAPARGSSLRRLRSAASRLRPAAPRSPGAGDAHVVVVGDQGAWSTAKMYFTVPPNGVAKLHFRGRTSRRRACPTRRQERWTSTASRSWTQPWRPATRWRRRRTRRPRRCC